MNTYFQHIVSKLTYNEMVILGLLHDQQANAVFKSITKKNAHESTELSLAEFRKSLIRLEANGFIETCSSQKEHRIFITNFGLVALNEQLKEEIEC